MSGRRPRVAFVVQRCGEEVNGGAEFLCLSVSKAMARVWDITVVTTTARDYMTWESYYPEGWGSLGDAKVVRFGVDRPRNPLHFDKLSHRMLAHLSSAPLEEQEAWMRAQGPHSTALLRYIEEHRDEYDVWIFYTYLYATTYFGLPLVEDRALLAPFAHDEWPIWMPMWERFFARPKKLIFSTPEEQAFLQRRFPRLQLDGPTIGIGIQAPAKPQADRFRHRFGIEGPFALYLGRIDPNKGCQRLIDDWGAYVGSGGDSSLLMLGREAMPVPRVPYLRALGFVHEETKFDALAGAEFLVVPSTHESLSIVILESWSVGRPVLVNAGSDVLVAQCRRSNGGLWYGDTAEFIAAARLLRTEDGTRLGNSGRHFVEERYAWNQIVADYQSALASAFPDRPVLSSAV